MLLLYPGELYRLLGASSYFVRLHCNLLNWSYLPFLFCAIVLQSSKLELPPFLAHLSFRPCELLSSLFVRRRSSINISHFNLLLRNHWTNCNQTLVEWSLDGPLSKLCPVIPTSNQDGRQAKNREKGGMQF